MNEMEKAPQDLFQERPNSWSIGGSAVSLRCGMQESLTAKPF